MSKETSGPKWQWRLGATGALLILWKLLSVIYATAQGPLEGRFAVGQLEDSTTGYALSRAAASGLIPSIINWTVIGVLALIWLTYIFGRLRRESSATALAIVLAAAALGQNGCIGPAKVEQFVEIKPSETAYMIPLEGASNAGQAKFESVEFLNAKKVAAKRVSLPLRVRSTGRAWWSYEYIATAMVIKVDRAPVTREWTPSARTGTNQGDQSFHMQSLDSIPFHIGATITASVVEDDASNFLYHYRADTVAHVVDTNVRSFILGELSGMFAGVDLATGMVEKNNYFTKATEDAKKYFKTRGLTIDYFGISGGLGYDNKKVQDSLDDKFIAENDKQVAENQQAAQEIRNATNVAKATADAQAAAKFAMAKDALTVKTEMEAVLIRAESLRMAAAKWDGKLPSGVVPQGSGFLFGLADAVPQK